MELSRLSGRLYGDSGRLCGTTLERELYHLLSVRDHADHDDEEEEEEDVPPHYDLFDSFKPEHNKHRPF